MREIKYIILHHSGTSATNGMGDSDGKQIFEAICRNHHARAIKENWLIDYVITGHSEDYVVDYHFLIGSTGKVFNGQPVEMVGYHCGNKAMNLKSIGICLLGDFEKTIPPKAQIDATISLLVDIIKKYKIPIENILRHKDIVSTACPGKYFLFNTMIGEVKNKMSEMKTLIMGKEMITVEQCRQFLLRYNPNAPDIIPFYKKHGEILRIKWGYAVAQMIHETGYLKYGGDVLPSQNNYAGIGAVGGGAHGATFTTPERGVIAHLQHLFAYATTDILVGETIDPRFNLVTRGHCPNWEDLNGHWAVPGIGYGEKIVSIYEKMATEVTLTDYEKEKKDAKVTMQRTVIITDFDEKEVNIDRLAVILARLIKYIQGGI